MWEGEPVHGKLAGPNSSMPPNCEQPDLLVGTYTFDCLNGIMESEDTDRNRFVLDVTKTTFLREDFSISREGGSTADGANSPTAPKEKAEKSKRSSSRPSSGKVGITLREGMHPRFKFTVSYCTHALSVSEVLFTKLSVKMNFTMPSCLSWVG